MVKLRARCLLVGDAAVGKSALSHMFYSDGTLFQKNYSMEWHPVWSLAAIAQLVVGDKRMQVYLASILGNDSHPTHGTVAALGSSFSERLFYLKCTTGVEVLIKCVNIPTTNDSVELYIIDSAGKETLVESCEKLWGEPSLLCLVFDLTSEQSFANCSRWMERVHAHCQGLHVPGVLVGNKLDLSARREVQASTAEEWAQSQGLEYHETSAKEMENCDAPLLSLARAFHSLYQERRETIQNLSPG